MLFCKWKMTAFGLSMVFFFFKISVIHMIFFLLVYICQYCELLAIRDWSPGNFLVFTNLLSIVFCVSLILSCPFLFETMNILSISTNMGMQNIWVLIFSFLSISAFLCFGYFVSHCWASSYCVSLSLFISYKGFILLAVSEKVVKRKTLIPNILCV